MKIVTVRELATELRCDYTMIYKLIKNNNLPYFKIGSDYRFNLDEIEKWINAQSTTSVKEEKNEAGNDIQPNVDPGNGTSTK